MQTAKDIKLETALLEFLPSNRMPKPAKNITESFQ